MIILVDQNYPTDEAVFDAHEARIKPLLHKLLDETPYDKVKNINSMHIEVVTQVDGTWKNVALNFHIELCGERTIAAYEERKIKRDQAYSDTLEDYYGYASLTELRRIYGNKNMIQPIDCLTDDQLKVEIEF